MHANFNFFKERSIGFMRLVSVYNTSKTLESPPIFPSFAAKKPDFLVIFFKVVLNSSSLGSLKVFQRFSLNTDCFSLIFSPVLVSFPEDRASIHSCAPTSVYVCVFVCMEWVFTHSGTFPAPHGQTSSWQAEIAHSSSHFITRPVEFKGPVKDQAEEAPHSFYTSTLLYHRC